MEEIVNKEINRKPREHIGSGEDGVEWVSLEHGRQIMRLRLMRAWPLLAVCGPHLRGHGAPGQKR